MNKRHLLLALALLTLLGLMLFVGRTASTPGSVAPAPARSASWGR